MIDNFKIGNKIALLRREKGMTGEQFAEKNRSVTARSQQMGEWQKPSGNGDIVPNFKNAWCFHRFDFNAAKAFYT